MRKLTRKEATRMQALRKTKSGGGLGRMPGAISPSKPRCPCGCGLTLARAMYRHPERARDSLEVVG